MQWEKTYGEKDYNEYVESLVITKDNGFIITVLKSSYHYDNTRNFIIKFDSSGNLSWEKETTAKGVHTVKNEQGEIYSIGIENGNFKIDKLD